MEASNLQRSSVKPAVRKMQHARDSRARLGDDRDSKHVMANSRAGNFPVLTIDFTVRSR